NQIQNLLCCDLNDQLFNAPQIVQGDGLFTRLPSGNSFTLAFLPRTGVVDNQNNLILIGTKSGVSHVLKLKQGLTTRDDRFTAQFTNELTVDAPGVLANDSAFGATIALDQPPINGSVVLNQDGSFVYTPDAGFNGGDFFRYEVEFQGERSSARVDISRTAFQTVTLSPVSVIGGEPSIGTLTMSLKPTVGIEALVLDNSTAVTTPASVVLSTLDKTTPFSLTTVPVSATFNATVTVTVSGITKQKTLQVKVGGLKALTLTGSTNVVAGDSRTVKVELTGVAEANTTVALTGTGPEASFPGSLIVPAGFSSKTFTMGIAQRTTPASFTLSAKLFDTTKTLTIAIEPMPKIVTLAAPDVIVGGLNVPLTVTLDKVTPFFLPVGLVLTQNPNSIATLPNSSIIFAGQSSAVFQVQTNVTLFTKVFTVQASVGGATKTRNVQVIRNPLESITAAPSPVIGGQPLSVTVNLSNLAPTGGITVGLSSNSQLISVPSTVFVPAGSWSATVPATTKSVVFQGRVTLTAKLSNVIRTVQVTISP
ncbi:MAG: Ig-like domain-containing protein, partial [Fimbriimonadaceae bacterium]